MTPEKFTEITEYKNCEKLVNVNNVVVITDRLLNSDWLGKKDYSSQCSPITETIIACVFLCPVLKSDEEITN